MDYAQVGDIVEAIDSVAESLHQLGLNRATTRMGAIESLSKEILDGTTRVADAISDLAEAVRERR